MSKTVSDNDLLQAANGTAIPLLGKATVNAVWNDKTIRLTGMITEHLDEVVLGLTWLQEQGAL